MSREPAQPLPKNNIQARGPRPCPIQRDDIAYLLPMFVFLGFVWLGGHWSKQYPWTYPAAYAARAFVVAALLAWLWPCFTRIRWNTWWLGIIVGVIGIFQWVPMQLWLQNRLPGLLPPNLSPLAVKFFAPSGDVF